MKAAGVLPFALFSATAINIFDDRTVPSSIKRTAPAGDCEAEVCRWDIAGGATFGSQDHLMDRGPLGIESVAQ
jgi:hypothetical protein